MDIAIEKILNDLIYKYDELEACREDISATFNLMAKCYNGGHKILICGNGGSAADAEHIVGELMKGFKNPRKLSAGKKEILANLYDDGKYLSDNLQEALPAISLVSGISLSTAFANDVSADMVYAQQVYGLGNKGDIVIGISTSGNSGSIISALKVAKAFGMKTIGLTGRSGGKMPKYCDVTIKVPQTDTYLVQELHLPVYHALCAMIEQEFFPNV
ncbi:MAG: D-sedoheptulose-7-phosphate isomerase [Saccharofermentanales bacterium]